MEPGNHPEHPRFVSGDSHSYWKYENSLVLESVGTLNDKVEYADLSFRVPTPMNFHNF